jgi:hypothetical protein
VTKLTAIKCADCGKFIALSDLCASRLRHVPLNEFGPEENEWTCPKCVERLRQSMVLLG